MQRLNPLEQQVQELEAALRHEREVSAAERKRCELLQDAVKRAYRLAASVRLPWTRT